MKVSVKISSIFSCSLARAFKSAMLCDPKIFQDTYLFQPKISHFEEEETWGVKNGIRYPINKATLLFKSRRMFRDQIIIRDENKRWQWKIDQIDFAPLFFTSGAIGDWKVREVGFNEVKIDYSYTYFSKGPISHLLNFLYVKIQMKGTMKKILAGIKAHAESQESYYFEENYPENFQ